MRPALLFAMAWIAWMVSWLAAAFWSGPTERRATTPSLWLYRIAVLAGAVLLLHSTGRMLGARRLWHVGLEGGYALAGLTWVSLAATWWARIYLGRLWSGAITRKQGHRVVDTGPYAYVRHPIYTGLIAAIWATAAAQATLSGLAGAALLTLGFWLKARFEERFLTAELGAAAYGEYRRRVRMLVAFLPRGDRGSHSQ